MRILTRSEFLQMPEGTLFSRYGRSGSFSPLEIKGATLPGNPPDDYWFSRTVDAVKADDTEEQFDLLRRAFGDSSFSVPMDFDNKERDGLFEQFAFDDADAAYDQTRYDEEQRESAHYAVWEKPDVEAYLKRIERAIQTGYQTPFASTLPQPGDVWTKDGLQREVVRTECYMGACTRDADYNVFWRRPGKTYETRIWLPGWRRWTQGALWLLPSTDTSDDSNS